MEVEKDVKTTMRQLFVCKNKPECSFSLDYNETELESLTFQDLFAAAKQKLSEVFPLEKMKGNPAPIQANMFFLRENLSRLVVNTFYQFKPFYFDTKDSKQAKVLKRVELLKQKVVTIQVKSKDTVNTDSASIAIEVSLNATAKELAELIQMKLQLSNRVYLFANDIMLVGRKCNSLEDWGISDSQEVQFELAKPYQIQLVRLDYDKSPYTVEAHFTVEQLKKIITKKFGIVFDEQRIIFDAKQLQDDVRLGDVKIVEGSIVYLVLRLYGGGDSGQKFVDLENSSSKEIKAFSDEAPEYRMCRSGINVEGYCTNTECKYYQKLVIAHVGYGAIEIIGDVYTQIHCPNYGCRQSIKPITCGFTNCLFDWKGVKSADVDGVAVDRFVSGLTEEASRETYTRFKETKKDGTTNLIIWKKLFIQARPIPYQPICAVCEKEMPNGKHISYGDCADTKKHIVHKECKKTLDNSQLQQSSRSDSCVICENHRSDR